MTPSLEEPNSLTLSAFMIFWTPGSPPTLYDPEYGYRERFGAQSLILPVWTLRLRWTWIRWKEGSLDEEKKLRLKTGNETSLERAYAMQVGEVLWDTENRTLVVSSVR
ncbi:hypothetical protein C0995_015678 [Termitomyces sp. Mi166|nr:hypothetical protein C0995_015678 [Termitomyces sp. Mi166\